ncbi:hypothetical protein Cob_v009783 [Colletotrichum orbiculare MAFF 240422]|uniref:Uncharacterized protein n=1 Tax=Colletotrichum orbiculare (strain 104-T / ATCC 96160 / CBS 514.97 / LARS 414 / MAFF 240422) TaxID=1213857 RepID=A0A484FI45_COLOR|nr:hypothetical protein Cob_v009783 [Colletotrichum orbiculare MAFF 240422]
MRPNFTNAKISSVWFGPTQLRDSFLAIAPINPVIGRESKKPLFILYAVFAWDIQRITDVFLMFTLLIKYGHRRNALRLKRRKDFGKELTPFPA